MTHICVSDLTSIGSDNGLSPGRRQAIIRTNAGILLIRPLGTNFSEFSVEILIFSFKKMRLKVSSAKRRPFCLGLNELNGLRGLSTKCCPFYSVLNVLIQPKWTKQNPPCEYMWSTIYMNCKTSSISRTKSQNLNVSCIPLQLSSLNPLKPGVKLRMKM